MKVYMDLIKSLKESVAHQKASLTRANALASSAKFKQVTDLVEAYDNGDTFNGYCYPSGGDIVVALYARELEGFKGERLMQILSAFENLAPNSNSTRDLPESMRREFDFTYQVGMKDYTSTIYLTVSAQVKTDSETCERVVIGMTEPVAQPIYKLVCSEA